MGIGMSISSVAGNSNLGAVVLMQLQFSRARLAAMTVLFCNGMLYATWGVSMPVIKEKFELSEGVLSLAMAVVAMGGIVTMAGAGRWINSVGSGKASVHSGLLMAFSAAGILLIPNYFALLPLLLIYGVATAANDVAANSQGSLLERQAKRSLIGSLHASFSVGGLIGSLISSWWFTSGLPMSANFWVLALAACLAIAACSRYLQNELSFGAQEVAVDGVVNEDPRVGRRLRLFGVLAFSALVVEGAFYDWAAVYMREVVKAPSSWVGFGYAAFAVGMSVGRLLGDKARDVFVHQIVMTASGLICMVGLVVVLSPTSFRCSSRLPDGWRRTSACRPPKVLR
jgi:predicted MFS family arabinose efflux permease